MNMNNICSCFLRNIQTKPSSTCYEFVAEGTLGPPGIPILHEYRRMARGRAEHFPAAQFARLNGVFIVVHGVLNFHLRDTMSTSGRKIKKIPLRCKQICCCAAQHLFILRGASRERCTPRATGCGFTSHKNAPATERAIAQTALVFILQAARARKMRQR